MREGYPCPVARASPERLRFCAQPRPRIGDREFDRPPVVVGLVEPAVRYLGDPQRVPERLART